MSTARHWRCFLNAWKQLLQQTCHKTCRASYQDTKPEPEDNNPEEDTDSSDVDAKPRLCAQHKRKGSLLAKKAAGLQGALLMLEWYRFLCSCKFRLPPRCQVISIAYPKLKNRSWKPSSEGSANPHGKEPFRFQTPSTSCGKREEVADAS